MPVTVRVWLTLAIGALTVACARGDRVQPSRAAPAEPVRSEVVDVRQTQDDRRIRWDYAIVLRETSGVAIQFDREEFSGLPSAGKAAGRPVRVRYRIERNGELRLGKVQVTEPQSSGAGPVSFTYTLSGRDEQGRRVSVPVPVRLDPTAPTKEAFERAAAGRAGPPAGSPAAATAPPTPSTSPAAAAAPPPPPTPPPVAAPAPPTTPPAPATVARATALEVEARQLLRDGQYVEGVTKAREAVTIREQLLGPRHLDTAESLNTLGELYGAQGQWADAERLHRRALAVREEALSRNHPLVAQSLNNLAMIHNARATYLEAEKMLVRALEILEGVRATMLRNHALQAAVLENLAKVYRALGKTAEAEEAEAKAAILSTLR